MIEEKKGQEETKLQTKKTLKKHRSTFGERRIAVHCVAGLGRSPLLVALAIVNKGCPPAHAIDLIRKMRYGAINVT